MTFFTTTTTTAPPWYEANYLIVNVCTVESGDVSKTREDDNDHLVLNECTGTPGFDFVFVFENIPEQVDFVRILLKGRYQGSPTHDVKLKIYNWTTLAWDDLTAATQDLPSRTTDRYYGWSINFGNDYKKETSLGEFHLKFEHVSAGDDAHDLFIDWLYLDECREWKLLDSPIVQTYPIESPIELICRSGIDTAEDLEED